MVFIFQFVNVVYYIDWFADIEVSLHPWDKAHLVLEENIGKTLSDIHHSRILYDPPPRILEIKAKINKWDLINLKSLKP